MERPRVQGKRRCRGVEYCEEGIVEIARRLDAGQTMGDLRDMRGVAFALGASETLPVDALTLPSFEAVRDDKLAFAEATRMIHDETNPYNARRLVQAHDRRAIVCNRPALPISEPAMDAVYGLPYTRILSRSHSTFASRTSFHSSGLKYLSVRPIQPGSRPTGVRCGSPRSVPP